MIKIGLLIFYIFLLSVVSAKGQTADEVFMPPFAFEHFLSGNFAELRSNHFHAGLDFKTQGVEGKPIMVIADGYIARAKVQAGGYGRALYVMHDNGYMTVYGHLLKFPEPVAQAVRERQYADECFAVDIAFAPGELPVKCGNVLAYAGNSGYSFGPHLHFEVRSADGEELYNPLLFYKDIVTDKKAPVAQAVAFYPLEGQGMVCGAPSSLVRKVQSGLLADTIEVWGRVGFGIKALDYMTGTTNKYGVYELDLYVDDSLRFSAKADSFSYSENRLINAWVDYERLAAGEGRFLRSFILPNNPLRMIDADAAGGIVDFCEERLYRVEYRLRDYHGNSSVCSFVVAGKPCDVVPVHRSGGKMLRWYLNNYVCNKGFSFDIPRGTLFDDAWVDVRDTISDTGSPIYIIGDKKIPLWHSARLTIEIPSHLLPYADKCYIEHIAGKKRKSAGGKVVDGAVTANIYTLGSYTVAVDTVAPKVRSVNEKQWVRNGRVVFAVADKNTGIASFRGTIDGRFVLFEYSSKNGRITCDFKREKVARGRRQLRLVVVDCVGNENVVEKNIIY